MTALVVLDTVVIVGLTLLVVALLRSHAEILRRLHDLGAGLDQPAGTATRGRGAGRTRSRAEQQTANRHGFTTFPEVPSPADRDGFPAGRDVVGTDPAGGALSIRVAGAPHRTLLAFLSSGCLTCARFWDAFAEPHKLGLPPDLRPVIVTKDPDEESPAKIAKLAPAEVPTVASSRAWASYDVPGSPYFVLVDGPSGQVRGEGTGMDWEQVRNLLTQASDDDLYAAEHPVLGLSDTDLVAAATAGAAAEHTPPRQGTKAEADARRERRVDDELAAAGVLPGDASLYTPPVPPEHLPSGPVPPDPTGPGA